MPNKTPEDWMVDIDNALEYRRRFGREDKWADLEKSYLNDPHSDAAIGANLIYSMGDSLMSSLNVPDPEISVSPEHPSGVDRAPIVESVDNWFIKKLKMKRAVDLSTLHSYLYGKGILKIGYDSEFGWDPYYDIGQGQSAGATLTQFDKKGYRIEDKNTIPGMPWVSVVSPHDFVVPYGTIFLDDAPWCAHRIIRKNQYFKSDPKYKNTTRLEPQMSMEDYMASYLKVPKDRAMQTSDRMMYANTRPEYNIAWEIHDRISNKVFVVAPDYDKYLRDSQNAMLVAGLPFIDVGFVTHPRSFWSTPQAYYLGQIQHIQSDIALQSEKQRRLNAFKLLAREGAMSREELTKLLSGDAGAVGMVKTGEPLSNVFMAAPRGNLMEFTIQSGYNKQDAREAIGYSRNQMGEFDQSSRRTAREATFVNQGSQQRSGRRAGAVGTLYLDTITKLNQVSFSFWKLPRFAMVNNGWVKYSGEELKGDYLYDLSLSSTRNLSRAERKIEALMMMGQLAQIPGINYPALFKFVQDAANDPAFERILAPLSGGGGQQRQLPASPNAQPNAAPGNLPTIPATRTGA